MRQKRAKAYKKLMALYSMSFGFRQPYQVLIDSEMCKSSADQKTDLVQLLSGVLQGEIKPMITQCCIHELYLQGGKQQSAVDLAKLFERRKCNHREPISGDECLTSVVGETNKHRYVIATQSQPLRAKLRKIPAVPIVHVNRSVMILEPPSDLTIETKESTEEKALHPVGVDLALVESSKTEEPIRKKKKGPKGPNPLSVKKKARPVPTPPVKRDVKGKGKETSDVSRNNVVVVDDAAESKLGEKRKREPEQSSHSAETNVEGPASRRRKRRKKAAAVVDVGGNS